MTRHARERRRYPTKDVQCKECKEIYDRECIAPTLRYGGSLCWACADSKNKANGIPSFWQEGQPKEEFIRWYVEKLKEAKEAIRSVDEDAVAQLQKRVQENPPRSKSEKRQVAAEWMDIAGIADPGLRSEILKVIQENSVYLPVELQYLINVGTIMQSLEGDSES